MKAHLTVFALSAILIASIGIAPAFGQSSVVISTDKPSYSEGETILVTGEVAQLLGGYGLTITVKSDLAIVYIGQLTVGADKKFSTTIAAGGSLMKNDGTYTITVQYGDNKNNAASTTFEFGGSTVTPPTDVSKVTETTVSVSGSNDLIGYEITGGKLVNIMPDVDANSLIVSIDATNDGSLTLTIPRSVLDATINGGDDDFFVLIDGEEVDFDETVSSTDRTLTIAFQHSQQVLKRLK
jgi:hypothetical protein